MDEARFGLKVTHRRLWCPFGSRPPWTHDHQYHWFWLYAAVESVSGTCVVLCSCRTSTGSASSASWKSCANTPAATRSGSCSTTAAATPAAKSTGHREDRAAALQPRTQPGGALVRGAAPGLRQRDLRHPGRPRSRSYRSSPALLAEPRQASASDRLPMVVLCHGRLELHRLSIGRKVGLKLKTLMISYFRNSITT